MLFIWVPLILLIVLAISAFVWLLKRTGMPRMRTLYQAPTWLWALVH